MTPDVTWHPFDPQDPGSPPAALDGTAAVAVVSSGDPQWAAAATVGLARAMARSGRRVFLCDADVENPRLHGFFEGEFGEGVSDLVLYGASPRRVAREVEERLLFVPAGTTVADAGRVRSSPRWDALVDAVAQADGILLLHLPGGGEGADALLARAERVVVVGDPGAVPDLGEAAERLMVGLHPTTTGPGMAPTDLLHATEPGSEAVHALPAEISASERAEASPGGGTPQGLGAGGSAPEVHLSSGSEVETPTNAAGEVLDDPRMRDAVDRARSGGSEAARSGGGGGRTLLLLILLVVLAVLAAAWFGVISIPGITPAQAGTVAPTAEAAASAPAPEREVRFTAPHDVWNLTLGSYTDPGAAQDLAARLGSAHPGVSFVVAPVEVDATLYHRVLAGPMPDSIGAAALRTLLADDVDGAADGVVRAAPLSFVAGETPDRAAAERRRGVLEDLGVQAHLLALARSDGSVVYRVYVGAYGDADEAAYMAAFLGERNVDSAPLTERLGTPPA